MVPHAERKGVLVWPLEFMAMERVFSLRSVVGVYVLSREWVEGLFTSSIADCVSSVVSL